MSAEIPSPAISSRIRTGIALAEKYYAAGLHDQAWDCLRPLVDDPDVSPQVLHVVASLCYEAGDLHHAESLSAKALVRAPGDADSLVLHGRVLLDLGRIAGAIERLRAAVEANPDHAPTHFNLGLALERAGALDDAVVAYRAAIARQECYPEAWNNLGLVLERSGGVDEAVAAFETALRLKPEFHFAASNLAALLIDQGHLGAAIRVANAAIAQDSTNIETHINLGVALLEQGRHADAHAAFAAALARAPDNKDAGDNAVYLHHYMSNDPAAVAAAHAAWGMRYASSFPPRKPYSSRRSARLRVGYVSPDFRRHSVSFFLEPLLTHHDRAAVEIFCYATGGSADAVTARLRRCADHWRDIAALSDDAAAQLIAEDHIDILVDLAGHTKGNRLGVFARRAAPVQVTALGYPGTTGLREIDFRLCDAVTDPIGTEAFATERLVRLPHGLHCYQSPADAPAMTDLPAFKRGFITFGSFNKLGKVSDNAIALWALVLSAIPDACLFLKSRVLADEETRTFTAARFAAHGIAPERLEMTGWVPDDAGHLAAYHKIDIALDTFPYSGTTTTCEALWMGVPVLTMAGATHASRVSASLLHGVGLDAWFTEEPQAFLEQAQRAARDLAGLSKLRMTLRARMRASPLCDGAAYAAAVEAAYRSMQVADMSPHS